MLFAASLLGDQHARNSVKYKPAVH